MPISFEIEYLRNLEEDSRSCVYLEHGKEHLALHPFQLDNINSSIKELLNKNIARYCRHLNGILLGYDNVKLLSSDGLICDDSCFVHTDIEADFYVFKPEIDSTLQGVINKISKDHVACLVHKTFTISLPKPDDAVTWIGNKAQIGQEVQFTIVEAVFDGSLPYIRGIIISLDSIDDSGFSTNEDPQGNDEDQLEEPLEISSHKVTESSEDQEEKEIKPRKQKKRKIDISAVHQDVETDQPKQKKKKIETNISAVHQDIEIDSRLKQKKKEKKNISGVHQDIEIDQPKQKKSKKNKVLELQINERTSKDHQKDKRMKGRLLEDDLLKVDFSVIHNGDYLENSELNKDYHKEEKKSKKRKRNAPLEDPIIMPKEIPLRQAKIKKRKRNALDGQQIAIASTSVITEVEVHNTEETFDNSLSKKRKKYQRTNSLETNEVPINEDRSRKRKKKDKTKQNGNEQNGSDDTTKIHDSTDKYEDLLKTFQINDKSSVEDLNNLLSKKQDKSKKEKKRKKPRKSSETNEDT